MNLLAWLRRTPRVVDERVYITGPAGTHQVTDALPRLRFHKDCAGCCRTGRCHWNPSTTSHVAILRVADGFTYRACRAHAAMLLTHSMNIGDQYDERANTPAVLRTA